MKRIAAVAISRSLVTFEPGAHSAAPTTSMAHIAIVEQPASGNATVWMEKVSDAQYGVASSPGSGQPTPAQRLIGDFSPKLVDLTDRVLFSGWPNATPEGREVVWSLYVSRALSVSATFSP